MFHVLHQTVLIIDNYKFNIVQYYDILLSICMLISGSCRSCQHIVKYAQTLTFCTVISAVTSYYLILLFYISLNIYMTIYYCVPTGM